MRLEHMSEKGRELCLSLLAEIGLLSTIFILRLEDKYSVSIDGALERDRWKAQNLIEGRCACKVFERNEAASRASCFA